MTLTPNVIIISLDAARAQNFGCYGYHRQTTPFLSSMERDCAFYENAISSSYWTMPSVASLFTGMYTSDHGLVADSDKLDESWTTLPGILRKKGYHCSAFVRNIYVSEYSGLTSDFDYYCKKDYKKKLKGMMSFLKSLTFGLEDGSNRTGDKHVSKVSQITKKQAFITALSRAAETFVDSGSSQLISNFGSWLSKHKSGPFFVYLHFMETHSPYRAPHLYGFRFLKLKEKIKELKVNRDHLRFLTKEREMTPDDFRILLASYDNAIFYSDALIGRIIGMLRQMGLYDNSLIIILSDHGDNIGDHGLMSHYWCLYDTVIKIPLLIKFPRHLSCIGRITRLAQNVDIFPTILSLLDVKDEKIWEQTQGNDLLGLMPAKREEEIAISELVKAFGPDKRRYRNLFACYDRRLLSIRSKTAKFIYSSRGDHEAYDLLNDPYELTNLFPDGGYLQDLMYKAREYYQKMDLFYQNNKYKIDADVDEHALDNEVVEKLKALGYL